MKVTKYEIDMLNVASADAFLIHFFDDDTNCEYIVLIDGGNYSDGKKIAKFIRDNYSQDYIDLAICTHCDDDHFCGIQYLLEQQRDNGKDNLCRGDGRSQPAFGGSEVLWCGRSFRLRGILYSRGAWAY